MSIQIANRYRPFSKEKESFCLLPGTFFVLHIFPSFIKISSEKEIIELKLGLTAPFKDFLVMQDIEKRKVFVSGFAKEGYFQYSIRQEQDKLLIKLERASFDALEIVLEKVEGVRHPYQKAVFLKKKEILSFETDQIATSLDLLEKISFGSHKAQDWQMIKRRKNPEEFFPLWFAIGQMAPKKELSFSKEAFLKELVELFDAGFSSLFAPEQISPQFFGMKDLAKEDFRFYPQYGYELIKKMLIEKKGETIEVLKNLPSIFHCGRAVNIQIQKGLVLHVIWSKKSIKKLQLLCLEDQKLKLSFENQLRSCRLVFPNQTKRTLSLEPILELSLKKGFYQIDRFEK